LIQPESRQMAIDLIAEAVNAGARQQSACDILEIDSRTLRRWQQQLQEEQALEDRRKKSAEGRTPANKLTVIEQDTIIEISNLPEYQSLPPSQIVPDLADHGRYIASESTFYRVLRNAGQINRRGRAEKPRKIQKPKGYKAVAPNQVWSWDITFLASAVKGSFYRLYMIEDIYSRKITGWEVHEDENAQHASVLIQKTCLSEGVSDGELVLHSDNGSPMKGATMLAMLQKLGVVPSFSRPSVSDDNPYSESLFRTLKYTPAYPTKPFESIEAAREWTHKFVAWYNEAHRHSAIQFVTPGQRHRGEHVDILNQRKEVYKAAKDRNPERWSGETRNWEAVLEVWLNPPKDLAEQNEKVA